MVQPGFKLRNFWSQKLPSQVASEHVVAGWSTSNHPCWLIEKLKVKIMEGRENTWPEWWTSKDLTCAKFHLAYTTQTKHNSYCLAANSNDWTLRYNFKSMKWSQNLLHVSLYHFPSPSVLSLRHRYSDFERII